MISLTYKNRPVTLPPGFQISWELQDDLLEFDSIGQGLSWPITIVRDGSEGIFLFAGDVDAADNLFKTYDGFAITFEGNVWWEVSFDLTGADDDYYEGNLTTVNSAYFENKDRKISEIITATIPVADATISEFRAIWNTENSIMRFPLINFRGQRVNFDWDFDPPVISYNLELWNSGATSLLPVFQWIYLVKAAIESIGMTFQDDAIDLSNPFVQKLLLAGNRPFNQPFESPVSANLDFSNIDNIVKVADYVPDLTLSELVRDFCLYACATLRIKQDGTFSVTAIDRVIDQPQAVTVKSYDPNIKVEINQFKNIGIDYNAIEVRELPDESLYRGTFNTLANFAAVSSPARGQYGFVKEFNRFYQFVEIRNQLEVRFLSQPFHPFQGAYTFSPTVRPVGKDRYVYYDYTNGEIVESSGKVRINGSFAVNVGAKINWLNEGENESEFDPYAVRGTITTVEDDYIITDIDYEDFLRPKTFGRYINNSRQAAPSGTRGQGGRVGAERDPRGQFRTAPVVQPEPPSISKIIIRPSVPSGNLFAVINAGINYPELNSFDKGFQGAAMIWHGNVTGYNSIQFASAWSDPWNQEGEEIGTVSFNTTGAKTMFNTIWQRTISFLANTRLLRIRTYLSAEELTNIYIVRKMRGLNFTSIFATLRCNITSKGIEDQEIEGWGV